MPNGESFAGRGRRARAVSRRAMSGQDLNDLAGSEAAGRRLADGAWRHRHPDQQRRPDHQPAVRRVLARGVRGSDAGQLLRRLCACPRRRARHEGEEATARSSTSARSPSTAAGTAMCPTSASKGAMLGLTKIARPRARSARRPRQRRLARRGRVGGRGARLRRPARSSTTTGSSRTRPEDAHPGGATSPSWCCSWSRRPPT